MTVYIYIYTHYSFVLLLFVKFCERNLNALKLDDVEFPLYLPD